MSRGILPVLLVLLLVPRDQLLLLLSQEAEVAWRRMKATSGNCYSFIQSRRRRRQGRP